MPSPSGRNRRRKARVRSCRETAEIRGLEESLHIQRGLAVHEAAHVVVARYFDFPVSVVTLTDGRGGGSANFPLRPNDILATRGLAVVTAAGNTAGDLCGHPSRSESDEKELVAAATRLHGTLASEDVILAEIADARRRAEIILREHWDNVLRTAVYLLRFHTLVADQLRSPSSDPFKLLGM